MNPARGFAVAERGVINVKTVGPTDIAAMVNWLWPDRAIVTRYWPDVQIREVFARHAANEGAELVAVVIEATTGKAA